MKTKGMENMTKEEGREIIREIMTAYNTYRELWIERFGTEKGFDAWFSTQT